ncbi:MAG TPA: PDZ domain-containing protein [Steroidobacteraceae bacterium]|nr:PDZ domain-containing protein [Steroidobacteraceae bacterium]
MLLFKRVRALRFAIVCAALLPLWTPAQAAEEKSPGKSQADIEAQLAAARTRLEAAAREVAELSGQLTGPIMQDFMIAGAAGMPQRAMLGINLGDQASTDGVRVQSVTPGGPASDAGLRAGDVLVSADGVNLRSKDKPSSAVLVEHMHNVKAGDKVKVEYLRDGKSHSAEITTEAFGPGRLVMGGMPDRFFTMRVPGPMEAVTGVPAVPGVPFTMAFPGANVLDMELVAMTPKLGKYFGTDKGVLVVRAPGDADLKLEDGDVILDIDGRVPQNGAHALRILSSYQPGEKLNINVLRDRKQTKLAVTVPTHDHEHMPGGAGAMWYGPGPMTKPFQGVQAPPLPPLPPLPDSDGPT